jgi:transposase
MEPKFFVGIDVSKITMDIAIIESGQLIGTFKIPNTEIGLLDFIKFLKDNYKCRGKNTLLCAESMGLFTNYLKTASEKHGMVICLESALRIKRSMGIQRGKNDSVDAVRIAEYAMKNYRSMKIWVSPRNCMLRLKSLSTIRKRLMKVLIMLKSQDKMHAYYIPKKEIEGISSLYNKSIEAVQADIENVNREMDFIIDSDERLSQLMKLQMSIPGIGRIIARQMIIATNEFIDFDTSRQFAAHCGVAPFEISSGGVSLGRTKVSHLADKELKALLHLGSMHFTRSTKYFLGRYYHRKVSEGKNKMSVLNAIRNKLLHRIFSCVKNNKLYTDN